MTTYPIPRGAHTPCESHPELHFPPLAGNSTPYTEAAKNLCAACPFTAPCAEWAIRRERWGVWGGLTEDERQTIRRQRGIVPDEPDMARLVGVWPRSRVSREDAKQNTACGDCGKPMTRGSLPRHRRTCQAGSVAS